MRLDEIEDQDNEVLREFMRRVAKDCKPFLNQKKPGQVMYRGLGLAQFPTIYDKRVRKDRLPTDTALIIHDIFNDFFYKKFQVEARSTSIFCSGKYSEARGYGNVYVVYPVRDFECIWSPKIDDLFSMTEKMIRREFQDYTDLHNNFDDDKAVNDGIMDEIEAKVVEFLQEGNYTNTDLTRALESGNELMVVTDFYHAINYRTTPVQPYLFDEAIYKLL